jgi:hypothetical protein
LQPFANPWASSEQGQITPCGPFHASPSVVQ